ncbi:MAG: hypothetical protein ACQGVC_20635 [Myxococcota bacterium]
MTPPQTRKPVSYGDCRCVCGSLVARLTDGGVELKCRRCKRTLVVPLSGGAPGLAPTRVPAVREAG